jgi:hypothetical protein
MKLKNKPLLDLIKTKQALLNHIRKGQRAYIMVAADLSLIGLENESHLCQMRYQVLKQMETEHKIQIKKLKANLSK